MVLHQVEIVVIAVDQLLKLGRDEIVVFLGLVLHIHFASITVDEDCDDELAFEVDVQNELLYLLTVPQHDQLVLSVSHSVVKAHTHRRRLREVQTWQHHALVHFVKENVLAIRLRVDIILDFSLFDRVAVSLQGHGFLPF